MHLFMKKIIILCFFIPVLAIISCTKDLSEININRVNPTTLDPALLLNNAIINTSFPTKTQIYEMSIVQQMVTPNGGVLAGGNFNQDSRDVTGAPVWAVYYQNVIKYTHDAIAKTKDDPARANLYNMARIWQAYAFMILTDTYGAVPYTEGGAARQTISCFRHMISNRIFIQNSSMSLQRLPQHSTIQVLQKLPIFCIQEMLINGESLVIRCC